MAPVRFIEDVMKLALESGIKGPFVDTLENIMYDTSDMKRHTGPRC